MSTAAYLKGILLIIISAIMFGINPAFSVMMRSGGMNLHVSILTRFVISAIIYFIIIAKRGELHLLKISKSSAKSLIVAGIFFFVMALTLLASYQFIPSGLATVIHFSYPAMVVILAVALKQQKPTIVVIIGIVLSLFAVGMISFPSSDVTYNKIGITLAILSAIAISIYVILLNQEGLKSLNSLVIVFYIAAIFTLAIIVWIIVDLSGVDTLSSMFKKINLEVVIGAIGFGVCCAVGVLLFAIGVKTVGGAIAGAVSTLEPLTAVIVGTVFFNEPLPSNFILACAFIFGATILLSLRGET